MTAQDRKAQINIRTGPGVSFSSRHYGLFGDRVLILSSARAEDGTIWYKIKFPNSGADGWVRNDFVNEDGN